ncbi:tripartite tricarboxylate transporter TctB family protein [Chloroflexota bacterium]
MKLRGDSYVLIAIMVISLVIIGFSLRMEYFATKLVPVVIGSAVFILAAIGLWRESSAGRKLRATVIEDETGSEEQATGVGHRYLINGAWLVGFVLAIYLLGSVIAISLFVLFYMKWLGTRWFVAITSAVITTAIMYGGFEFAVNIELYRGLIFGG